MRQQPPRHSDTPVGRLIRPGLFRSFTETLKGVRPSEKTRGLAKGEALLDATGRDQTASDHRAHRSLSSRLSATEVRTPRRTKSIIPFTVRSLGSIPAHISTSRPSRDRAHRAIAILLVVGDCIVERGEHHGGEKLLPAGALVVGECDLLNVIEHTLSSSSLLSPQSY